jgi:hypothetical protein
VFCEDSLGDEKLLPALEHVRQLVPQGPRLTCERREYERAHQRDESNHEQIQNEDRQPAWKALRPDRQRLLTFDQADHRAEADGEQATDVDQQENAANEKRAPQNDDSEEKQGDRPEYERFDF